jgi:hypothetical protein
VLWKHRTMILNPRYGRIGMFVLPYYVAFELIGPVVELLGIATIVGLFTLSGVAALMGEHIWLFNSHFALAFSLVALGYGFFLSAAAITIEEFSFRRMSSWRALFVSFMASVAENVGYRQLHAWWRLKGLVWWLRGGELVWGTMPRTGFSSASPSVTSVTSVAPVAPGSSERRAVGFESGLTS